MKKFIAAALSVLIAAANCATVFAQETPYPAKGEANIEEAYPLPDVPEFGELVDCSVIDNGDGSSIVERVYVKYPENVPYSTNGSETATYTKTASYIILQQTMYTIYVTATFTWNTADKTVFVDDEEGGLLSDSTSGTTTSESLTTSGDGTRKAKAKYSVKRTAKNGGKSSLTATVACDYKGNQS